VKYHFACHFAVSCTDIHFVLDEKFDKFVAL